MAPNNRVSRGNTADLVGLWNRIATSENEAVTPQRSRSRSPISGNLTTTNQLKFRKTSAYEPSPSSLSPDVYRPDTQVRKTSALVLMPTRKTLGIDTTEAVTGGESGYKPRKVSSIVIPANQLSPNAGYPLKSALKNSTGNLSQEATSTIPMVVTSPPPCSDSKLLSAEQNQGKRGTNLGRSKSVKCNRVKFEMVSDEQTQGVSTRHGHSKQVTSPFDKFRDLENQSHATSTVSPGRLTRQASLPSVSAPPPVQQQQPQPQQSGNNLTQKRSFMSRSPSSTKELLLMWVQQRTNSYPNLNVTNFSSSWSDGLAFCALIHYYYPEAFDFDKLDPKNRRENFELAFTTAEDYAGICPLLDVEDMMIMSKPDWKCVFTYVQSFYRRFRNGRDPPPPTRPLTLQPEETQ